MRLKYFLDDFWKCISLFFTLHGLIFQGPEPGFYRPRAIIRACGTEPPAPYVIRVRRNGETDSEINVVDASSANRHSVLNVPPCRAVVTATRVTGRIKTFPGLCQRFSNAARSCASHVCAVRVKSFCSWHRSVLITIVKPVKRIRRHFIILRIPKQTHYDIKRPTVPCIRVRELKRIYGLGMVAGGIEKSCTLIFSWMFRNNVIILNYQSSIRFLWSCVVTSRFFLNVGHIVTQQFYIFFSFLFVLLINL